MCWFLLKDVYVVAVPAAYGPYDAEVQKKLLRAEKRKILEDLKEDEAFKAGDFHKRTNQTCKTANSAINFRVVW